MSEPTSIRLDSEAKEKAYAVFRKVGLKPAQAINLFLNQVVLHGGLPFEVKVPNKETLAAFEETKNGGGHLYNTAEEFYEDLEI